MVPGTNNSSGTVQPAPSFFKTESSSIVVLEVGFCNCLWLGLSVKDTKAETFDYLVKEIKMSKHNLYTNQYAVALAEVDYIPRRTSLTKSEV